MKWSKHTGMKVSMVGLLKQVAGGLKQTIAHLGYSHAIKELLGHLQETSERFYAGQIHVVDEFFQLYDLADKRPEDVTGWLFKARLMVVPDKPDEVLEPFLQDAFHRYMEEKGYIKKPVKCDKCGDSGEERVCGSRLIKYIKCSCTEDPTSYFRFKQEMEK